MASSSATSFAVAALFLALTRQATAQSDQPSNYDQVRYAHAVFGSLAMIIFFPAGAILIRLWVLHGLVWWHAALQLFAYGLFLINVGTGIWMANTTAQWQASHPVIGIILFGLFTMQPILGLVHHFVWRKQSSRTFWGHLHSILGRSLIGLGILNGGLGLELAGNATAADAIAYGVVGGLVWISYLITMASAEIHRSTKEEGASILLTDDVK